MHVARLQRRRILAHPLLIPRTLQLSFAGIRIEVCSVDPALELSVLDPLGRFIVSGMTPDVRVEAAFADLAGESGEAGKPVFHCPLWSLRRDGSDWTYRFLSPALGPVPYKIASFSEDFRLGQVRLHRPYFSQASALYPLEYPLDELLVTNRLGQGLGVEVHACGVVDRSQNGLLFVGQSGAGKTTMARLVEGEGHEVLSDDRIIVRDAGDGGFRIYGTPWHGDAELAAAGQGRLGAIYFLRHGPTNAIQTLGAADAASRLLACSFVPFYDAGALDFSLGFWEQVCSRVPCRELTFVPDKSVLEHLGL